ncbi:MAG: DUF3095 domain-containing protein [Pseudomonadota bacterium]
MSYAVRPDIPVLTRFEQVADGSVYVPLPDDWHIGIADVVNSTGAIDAGRYKSVNFAGAATISAVTNALGGKLTLFAFGGDGACFAVEPGQSEKATAALERVAAWVKRELGLNLRVGATSVSDVRKAGFDVRAAYWQASAHVKYTLFSGGGLEWAEKALKNGEITLTPAADAADPDLTGLSCQWGPVSSTHGKIISLIVKPVEGAQSDRFEKATQEIIAALQTAETANPLPESGPDVIWPQNAIDLQARTRRGKAALAWKKAVTVAVTFFYWTLFKLAIPVRGFDPGQYRADVAANSDFQKFNDGLMMTVDCSDQAIGALQSILKKAEADGIIRYGLELQDEAQITCVVPSAFSRDHMHFIDGSGGGYASAAKQLRIND